mgnify:CR=1 FL=1
MSNKKLKVKLKAVAANKNISFVTISEQTDIPYTWLSNFANNHISLIQVDKLVKLCDILNCSPSDLLEVIQEDITDEKKNNLAVA